MLSAGPPGAGSEVGQVDGFPVPAITNHMDTYAVRNFTVADHVNAVPDVLRWYTVSLPADHRLDPLLQPGHRTVVGTAESLAVQRRVVPLVLQWSTEDVRDHVGLGVGPGRAEGTARSDPGRKRGCSFLPDP